MNRVFTPDAKRERATELRHLLARLDEGAGEDRGLGCDILAAIDAPFLVGDPTAFLSSALRIATLLGQDSLETLAACVRAARERVTTGKWSKGAISEDDVARITCGIALRVHIAELERAPA